MMMNPSQNSKRRPIMKSPALFLVGLCVFLLSGSVFGPKPQISNTPQAAINRPWGQLDEMIAEQEAEVANIRPGNESKIYWTNSIRQTEYCIVYLHGFSASGVEANPMHHELARRYGMNLYAPRLFAHGITAEDAMFELTVEDYVNSAKEAIAIGKKMGEKVILMGSSTGCTLSLYLATGDPQVVGLLLLSPNIKIAQRGVSLFTGPFGLQIARMFVGSHIEWSHPNQEVKKYWTMRYRTEALVQLQILVKATMKKKTFQQVTQPVFLGYYYKNKEEQDNVVSVKAMLRMFEQLGTPDELKTKVAFPKAGTHSIVSPLHSQDTKRVKYQLQKFIENTLKIPPLEQ